MKLQTHIAFGLFFGILFYYFLGLGIDFVLLTGFAAYLPDIDWAMQFKWGWGNRHRTFGHNVWFMIGIASIFAFAFSSILVMLGIIIGIVSHLLADSFTVTGVSWLYPYGYEKKFYFKGSWSMSDDKEKLMEKRLQIVLLTITGFLFITKGLVINIFSLDGIISIAIFIFVGYILFKNFDKVIVKVIRNLRI